MEELDLRALRAFVSVAEHGSLTRASAALEVAQSALSRRISALETELGGRLFHRTGRGATATDLARTLLPRARAMLADNDALRAEAQGEQTSPAGTVTLGLVPAVARPLVSALVVRLRKEFPRVRLCALEAYSGQVEEWLAAGRVDIGVFNRYGRAKVRGAELFAESPLVVVVAARRPGAVPSEWPFRALAGLPLVLAPRPNSLTATLADLAARHNIKLDVVLEAGSSALVRDAVAHAGLATLVPKHFAEREYAGAEFKRIPVIKPAIRQQAWLALTSQRPASQAVRAVARMVLEMAPSSPRLRVPAWRALAQPAHIRKAGLPELSIPQMAGDEENVRSEPWRSRAVRLTPPIDRATESPPHAASRAPSASARPALPPR